MTFKKFLPVFTALLLALTLVLASVSVMAAGAESVPEETIGSEILEVAENTEGTETEEVLDNDGYNPGDINGDGNIDVNDVTTLQSVFVGLAQRTETVNRNGDTNVDGKINIWDATVIQLRIANVFKELPVTVDGYYARIIRP